MVLWGGEEGDKISLMINIEGTTKKGYRRDTNGVGLIQSMSGNLKNVAPMGGESQPGGLREWKWDTQNFASDSR